MELDMLLNDLPQPSATPPPKLPAPSLTAYRIPVPSVGAKGDLEHLHQEERALEGQVNNLTNKREQLAGELEGLISQVGHMTITWVDETV